MPKSLWLAGPDGAGKSTQAARLARALEARGQTVRIVTIWDLFTSGAMPFRGKGEIDAFLGGLHPDARAMFLHSAMREALDRALDDRGDAVLLVVGYWLKYNATERAYGADDRLLDALAASFPPTELAIWLSLAPERALARKEAVSGYESGYGGREGFLTFQAQNTAALDALRARMTGQAWVEVDGAASPDAVTAALLAAVGPWLEARA